MILLPFYQGTIFQEGLQADSRILETAFTAIHPGLYRYNMPSEISRDFDRLRRDWAGCMDLKQAYVALSQFTAKIRCGHTYPNFFNQPKAVVDQVFAGRNRLPCYFRWLDGHMVVIKDFTPAHILPKGSEITSIDGIPCGRILKRLMTIARADGANDHKRTAYLSVTGDDTFEAFDIYFPLMFDVGGGNFNLRVRDLAHKSRTVIAAPLSMEDRAAIYREASSAGDPWNLKIEGPTATLTMPTWEMFNRKWDWEAFLRTSFANLKTAAVKSLIIDLRGNEGGSSIGDVLAAYLISQPLQLKGYHEYTRFTTIDPSLRPYLDTWDRSFDDWSKWTSSPQTIPTGANLFYRMTRYEAKDGDVIQPEVNRFQGKVIVLVDSSNSSATFEFENLAQTYWLATLVGEPTGGNLRGINGGAFFFLRLPNSKLEVDLPLIAQFPNKPQPDRGLIPDVAVSPTREDIGSGRDAVLERAKKLAPGGTR